VRLGIRLGSTILGFVPPREIITSFLSPSMFGVERDVEGLVGF